MTGNAMQCDNISFYYGVCVDPGRYMNSAFVRSYALSCATASAFEENIDLCHVIGPASGAKLP